MRYLLMFFAFAMTMAFAQAQVLVDGKFEEWENIEAAYTDAPNDGRIFGVDFGKLQIYNDPNFIFFLLETTREINLQNDNDLTIYLDTDMNASTGLAVNGIGAELVYEFGNKTGLTYLSGSVFSVGHDDLFLVTAPTVTSTKFEIAFRRDTRLFGFSLFPSNRFRVVFEDKSFNGDVLPSERGGITHTFGDVIQEPMPDYSIQQVANSDFRVLSYNVLSNGIFSASKEARFGRILRAVDAQIIGFQEAYDVGASQFLSTMERLQPSEAGERWYHADVAPDIHVLSRFPILDSYRIRGYNGGQGNGAFLIDVPGVPKKLLFIVLHPPCCNNEDNRQFELDAVMAFLRDVREGRAPLQVEEGAPIIIAGDMNLVGGQDQLETLLTGNIDDERTFGPDFRPDWNESDLVDGHPYTTNLPMSFTWFDERSSFSPGRLDFCIYSGSNLELQNSFALFTETLPQDSLTTYGLLASDAISASDHLPIVADFRWRRTTSAVEAVAAAQISLELFPVPTSGTTTASFDLPEAATLSLDLVDTQGKVSALLSGQKLAAGRHSFSFDASQFAKGVYVLRVNTGDFVVTQKLVIL